MPHDQDLRGAVLHLVAQIPPGKVTTYGAIAQAIQINPRQVGRILHSNTNPNKYPCHRVIHADGTTASGYVFGGPGIQQSLLEKEGVVFAGARVAGESYFFADFTDKNETVK